MPTSRKSNGSLNRSRSAARPFDPTVLRRAKKTVADYRIILEKSDELGYIGTAIEMPTVFADGATPDKCVQATRQALAVAAATMIESGLRPPSSRGTRSMQVNVRLAPEEKFRLQEVATRLGFRGISDFIRAVALDRCSQA